jgi:hypothetical protein
MYGAVNASELTPAAKQDASRGLRDEGTLVLWPGSFLFKLVERADKSDSDLMLSPWWFQEAAIRKILVDARDQRNNSGITLNNAACMQARENAGLSRMWNGSGANYLLVGKVIGPVEVIWGAPKPVGVLTGGDDSTSGLETGSNIESIEIIPNPLCVQFYLPGMRNHLIARKCISPKGKFKFAHSAELASGDIEGFLRTVKGGT